MKNYLRASRGELFGPENAQLPVPTMLMFDRNFEINDNGGQDGHRPDYR